MDTVPISPTKAGPTEAQQRPTASVPRADSSSYLPRVPKDAPVAISMGTTDDDHPDATVLSSVALTPVDKVPIANASTSVKQPQQPLEQEELDDPENPTCCACVKPIGPWQQAFLFVFSLVVFLLCFLFHELHVKSVGEEKLVQARQVSAAAIAVSSIAIAFYLFYAFQRPYFNMVSMVVCASVSLAMIFLATLQMVWDQTVFDRMQGRTTAECLKFYEGCCVRGAVTLSPEKPQCSQVPWCDEPGPSNCKQPFLVDISLLLVVYLVAIVPLVLQSILVGMAWWKSRKQ